MKNAIIEIEGRVFKDAITVGNNVTKFTVGVYNGKDKTTGKGRSEFFNVVDWDGVHTFSPKDGDYVKVYGELTMSDYTAKDGTVKKDIGVKPTKIVKAKAPWDNAPVESDTVDF